MPLIMIPTIGSKSFAMLLAMSSDGALGTPQLLDEISLAMRIEDATDAELGPGSRAILAFDVSHFGPTNSSPIYVVSQSHIPVEPNQPIRLSGAAGSECDFFAYESVNPNYPGWTYAMTLDAPVFGVIQTCRVHLEVLEPARGGYQVTFFAGAGDGIIWTDPDFRNNRVWLHVGGGQALNAVPAGGMLGLLMLILGLVSAGLHSLRRQASNCCNSAA